MGGGCVAYGRPSVLVVVVVRFFVAYISLHRRPRRRRLSLIIAIASSSATIRLTMRVVKPLGEITNDVSNCLLYTSDAADE